MEDFDLSHSENLLKKRYCMKITSLVLFVSSLLPSLGSAVESEPASRQFQVYPKNLARQHLGSNLFVFKAENQTYVPTQAGAAWLDGDITTGWSPMPGKQQYLLAFAEPELVSNISFSGRPAAGTVSLYAGDEPAIPGARTWVSLVQDVAFNSVNEKKLAKPFTRYAKYVLIETDLADPGPIYSLNVYGEKPAVSYAIRRRAQSIDARAIFGQFINDKTSFNANGLYTQSSVAYANSADGSVAWQRAIDDNPETGVAISGSTSDSGIVIRYGTAQSISRVALLTDGVAKGKLDFFAINDSAAGTSSAVSLEGRTPATSLVLDGSTSRSSMDFPAVPATAMAVRWSPVVPGETITIREFESFGTATLNDYEVGLTDAARLAYDSHAGTRHHGTGNDGKDGKEIAEGPSGRDGKEPAEVADFHGGSPYLPQSLGFPPFLNSRSLRAPVSN